MKLNSLTSRIVLGLALVATPFMAQVASAQATTAAAQSCTAGLQPGDYRKIEVAAVDSMAQKMNKDVIIEFFSYACIHCANLYPALVAAKTQDKKLDAQLVYVPASFRPDWEQAAKLYYALVSQKLDSPENHLKVFEGAHKNKDYRSMFMDEKVLTEFLTKTFGEDKSKAILADMKGFGVNTQVSHAKTATQKYKIDATPIFIVDKLKGEQYRVDGQTSGTLEKILSSIGRFAANDCK